MSTLNTISEALVDATYRRPVIIGVLVACGVLIAVAPQVVGQFWVSVLIQVMIFGLFALSHDLLVGHTGLLPLGHAAFFSTAAYGTAILQVDLGQGPVIAVLGGLLAGVVLSMIFGVAVRATGVYFILLTMSFGLIVWGTAHRWTSVTGGDGGIGGIRPPTVNGVELTSLQNYYYVVFAVVVAAVWAYHRVVRSPFGLVLHGIRESESRMEALGYNVRVHKYVAFVMSGSLAGVAGVLYVYWNKFMSPAATELIRSAEAVLMLVIGGSNTLLGPFLGAGIVLSIRNQLSAYMDRYMLVMGLVFVLTALFASRGLIGVFHSQRRRRRREVEAPVRTEQGGEAS